MNDDVFALPLQLFPLANALTSAVMLHRGDKILFANDALSRLSGYAPEELADMDFWSLFPPPACNSIRERDSGRLDSPRPTTLDETVILTRSGETRWVEMSVSDQIVANAPTVCYSILDVTDRMRAEADHLQARQLLAQIIESGPVPTIVIDACHRVTHWNRACEQVVGIGAASMVDTRGQWRAFYESERPILADLIVSGTIDEMIELYGAQNLRRSTVIDGAYEAESHFPHLGTHGRWLYATAAPLRNDAGEVIGAIETLQDITERKHAENALRKMQAELEATVAQRTSELSHAKATLEEDIKRRETAEAELLKRYAELTELNCRLQETHQQLIQSEKLASIGQLAAGVAHEINNPIGYVNSNIRSLKGYMAQLLDVFDTYEKCEADLPPAAREAIAAAKERADFAYLRDDIGQLISESEEGTGRVRKIVQDLRDFSRTDSSREDWQPADLHAGLDSTLNIASNEIKYKADVVREYGELPLVECQLSQLNQVFMNLFVNAAQAMPDERRGTIRVRTGSAGDTVWIEIDDNGRGIPPDLIDRIFDPFFTTKPIGKGTGLGLALSYGIVQKHHGNITASSTPGAGTTFRITLPAQHPADPGEAS